MHETISFLVHNILDTVQCHNRGCNLGIKQQPAVWHKLDKEDTLISWYQDCENDDDGDDDNDDEEEEEEEKEKEDNEKDE